MSIHIITTKNIAAIELVISLKMTQSELYYDVTCSVESSICGGYTCSTGNIFIRFFYFLTDTHRLGLVLCIAAPIQRSTHKVDKIRNKYKSIQHKHNLWFVDTHTDTHVHTPPPTHQSVHSAGTNSNRLQRDCRPELWASGRVVIEKQ